MDMNKEAFLTKLADVMEVSSQELTENFELTANNWDSMAHLATIALIDEQFGVTVPSNDLMKCSSIGNLLQLVQSNLKSAASVHEG